MLIGQELLNRARSLSNRSEDEIAKGCGYVGPSGRVLRKSFYKALVEAKGYKLPSASSGEEEPEADKLNSRPGCTGMEIC